MSEPGPFYHGTAYMFAPGDLLDPSYELGGRRGRSFCYVTTDPDVARAYGQHKAAAERAIGCADAIGHAYEVRPTGPVAPDITVHERFAAWRTRHPMIIVREI